MNCHHLILCPGFMTKTVSVWSLHILPCKNCHSESLTCPQVWAWGWMECKSSTFTNQDLNNNMTVFIFYFQPSIQTICNSSGLQMQRLSQYVDLFQTEVQNSCSAIPLCSRGCDPPSPTPPALHSPWGRHTPLDAGRSRGIKAESTRTQTAGG